jgi:hypothetical protein
LFISSFLQYFNQKSDLNPVHSQEQGASSKTLSKNSGKFFQNAKPLKLVIQLLKIHILFRLKLVA